MRIYKYKLDNPNNQIKMPKNAEILSCGSIDNELFIWALVNPEETKTKQQLIRIFPTGCIDFLKCDGLKKNFIGTAIMENGLVWHLFKGVEL